MRSFAERPKDRGGAGLDHAAKQKDGYDVLRCIAAPNSNDAHAKQEDGEERISG